MNVYLKLKGVKWEELKKKTDANRADFLYLRFKLIEAEYLKENNHSIDAAVIYDNAIRNPILKEFPQQLEELSDKAVIAALFAPSGQRRLVFLLTSHKPMLSKPPNCALSPGKAYEQRADL
jgi:uncharacterized Fe-S cluster-containing radical SAM superfamily protein